MANKRVAVLTGIYPPDSGGPATFAVSFSDFVVKRGGTVKVISLTNGRGATKREQKSTVRLISRKHGLILRTLIVTVEIFREYWRKSDVIANGFFIEAYIASFFLRSTYTAKVPGDIVWERAINSGITNLDTLGFQDQELNFKYRLFRLYFTKSLLKAKSVIVPSPVLYDLCVHWGIPKSKIHLIYNSVDIDYFKPGSNNDFKYDCIVVNRLVELKNVDEVMIACKNLGLSLLVVGDGPEMQKLTALSKTLGSKIDLVGNASQAQLIEFLQSSKFYVLNSTADATAYSLLEARACGVISIANIETGASQIIDHQRDGFLTKSTSHEEIERALQWLLSMNSSALKAMRDASRASTVDRFNRDNNFQRILDLAVH